MRSAGTDLAESGRVRVWWLALLLALALTRPAAAAPVVVRFPESATHGFLVLRGANGDDKFFVGDVARTATRYLVKMELRGLTGVVASILGKDPPQVRYWISGAAPAFVKFEGPLFLNGPPWRIELTGPRWER